MTDIKKEEEISSVPLSNAGVAVKDGIVASLKGINEIETEMVSVARTAISGTLGATGDIANEGFNIAKGLIMGVSEVGGDLIAVAGQTAKGAVQVASEVGKTATLSVTEILVGVAGGAKEVLGAILPQPGRRTGYEAAREETSAEAESKEPA